MVLQVQKFGQKKKKDLIKLSKLPEGISSYDLPDDDAVIILAKDQQMIEG